MFDMKRAVTGYLIKDKYLTKTAGRLHFKLIIYNFLIADIHHFIIRVCPHNHSNI